jgi:glutathione synthase
MIAIGLTVNDIATELDEYTTTHLAMNAVNMGHRVWYIQVADFELSPSNANMAWAIPVSSRQHRSTHAFMRDVREQTGAPELIGVDELDVLWLRNDPSNDAVKRPWARMAAINFGRLAKQHGVLVLNDPDGLALGITKLYTQYFPESVRPRCLISRHRESIKSFVNEEGGWAVLKPLCGSGGHNVFLVRPEDAPNINQMIEAVASEGYVIVQEYLPDAKRGDTRLFLMNGEPLVSKGHIAAMQRVRRSDDADMRSNMTAGAVSRPAVITEKMLEIAETIRPRLEQDGIFFAGLDIVDGKLLEVNVQSPGGIHSAGAHEHVNFSRELIHALERKVAYVRQHGRAFDNAALCVLR